MGGLGWGRHAPTSGREGALSHTGFHMSSELRDDCLGGWVHFVGRLNRMVRARRGHLQGVFKTLQALRVAEGTPLSSLRNVKVT